jgi:NitT/TauT family transport system ATP-binding protein
MLRLAEVEGGDIRLSETAILFANAEVDERKRIFARHLLNYVPLAAHIRRILDERESHTAPSWRSPHFWRDVSSVGSGSTR